MKDITKLGYLFEDQIFYQLPEAAESTFSTGENAKKDLILFKNETEIDLPEEESILLKNLLKAIKINLEETIILNTARKGSEGLLKEARAAGVKRVLVFGELMAPFRLNPEVSYYKAYKLADMTIVLSHSLAELGKDGRKKSRLWDTLQVVYEIAPAPKAAQE